MKEQLLQVLIVEDSESDELLLIRELRKSGYNMMYQWVKSAAAMKKALKDKPWEIILYDYNLQKFNVTSAIALLKEANMDIPVIIISGTIGAEKNIDYMRLGARDYITKDNLSRLGPVIARELEQVKARKRQKQAEEDIFKLASIVRFSSEFVGLASLEGKGFFINEAGSRIWGIEPEKIADYSIADFIPQELLPMVMREIGNVLETGSRWEGDLPFRNIQTGEITDVHATGFVINDDVTGEALYLAIIAHDITERKRMEEELRESEQKYQSLFNSSLEPIAVFSGMPPKILIVNPAFVRRFGYTLDEILEGSTDDIFTGVHPEDRQMVKRHLFGRFRQEDTPGQYEFRALTKDGQVCWLEVSASMFSIKGKLYVQAIYRDITERKRMVEELRESENLYRKFFNTSRDCVFITSMKGDWIDVNDVALELFGYAGREELTRVNIPDLYANAQDRIKLIDTIMELGYVQDYAVDLLRTDGKVIHALVTATIRYGTDGNATGFMGTIKDITKHKKAEEESRAFASIVRFSNDMVSLTTLEGKMIFLNEAGRKILGIEPDKIGDYSIYDVIPETLQPIVKEEIIPTLMIGNFWEGDLQYKNIRTGALTDVHAMTFTVKDTDAGKYLYLANISYNITEHKQAGQGASSKRQGAGSE
jgi:PAS domain S-box-containing protein